MASQCQLYLCQLYLCQLYLCQLYPRARGSPGGEKGTLVVGG